jgi:transcriptional regulator with XRE-family HTH domain
MKKQIVGERIRQLRLARSLSLEALAAKMGGIVTRQALSKYELGKANPSPYVLNKLAETLGVKTSYFLTDPEITVEFIAYRKSHRLLEKDKKSLQALIGHRLEMRTQIKNLLGQDVISHIPLKEFKVQNLEDTERAAEQLRHNWKLALNPIQNLVAILEDNALSVLDIEASSAFDGISAIVRDKENHIKTAALVTRRGIAGERQRLNLAHELGHLVLDIAENIDEEKAAFRFGAAFLAPAPKIYQEVGEKRAFIQLQELMLLKKQYGLSLQALVCRLHDLQIINDSYYKQWFKEFNRLGWRKREPQERAFEKSYWLKQSVLRLVAEGAMTELDAQRFLGEKLKLDTPASVKKRRVFMKLPIDKRQEILRQQASQVATHYDKDNEWRELEEGGDLY